MNNISYGLRDSSNSKWAQLDQIGNILLNPKMKALKTIHYQKLKKNVQTPNSLSNLKAV